jgi:alanyl-tRNA synthetase
MTKKCFWDNPYQISLLTSVAIVNGAEITLQSTIFFAFSGGQESDQGTIAGNPVLEARKDGLEIIYTLPANHGLKAGQSVQVEIDWIRRHRLMRLHFAAELVLELFNKMFPGIEKIGAHIAPEKARIDFRWPESLSPTIPEISREANRVVEADLEIKSAFEDEQNERRYWEIAGFARVPCGGTHLRRTGEIGPIKLRRDNVGRGKERIEITLINP